MQCRFDHVHIVASDPDASARFYGEMLGATTTAREEARGTVTVRMKLDGVNLFIRQNREGEQVVGDGSDLRFSYDHFGVMVDNLEAFVEEVCAMGAKVLREPTQLRPETKIAFIEGPDRTRIEIVQRG